MARKLPERVGGGVALEYSARTSMELTKAKLEGYGAKSGDLLLLFPYYENSAARTWTGLTPTAIKSGTAEGSIPGGSFRQGGLWVIWDGSTAIKTAWTGSVGSVFVVEVVRYFDPSNPIDVSGSWKERSASAKDELASITTVTTNTLQWIVTVSGGGTQNKAVPSGWTQATKYSPHTFRRNREAEGETGSTTVEYEASNNGVALSFAVRGEEEAGVANSLPMVI